MHTSVVHEDFLDQPSIEIFSDFDGMAALIKDHHPNVKVVVWFAVELRSFAFVLDVRFIANHLQLIN